METESLNSEQLTYDQALAAYQQDATVHTCIELADAAYDLERWQESLDLAEQAIALTEDDQLQQLDYVKAIYRKAILQDKLEHPEDYFAQLLALGKTYKHSDNSQIILLVSKAFINCGIHYARRREFEPEIAIYNELLEIIDQRQEDILQEPCARAHVFRIESYERLSLHSELIEQGQAFIERYALTEDDAIAEHVNSAYYFLGDAYEETEQYQAGIDNYEQHKAWLKLHPALEQSEMTSVLFRQAYLYRMQQQWQAAEDLLDQAIALSEGEEDEQISSWSVAIYNKSLIFSAQERMDDELACYDLLIKRLWNCKLPRVENRVAHALFNKALLMDRSGDHLSEIKFYTMLFERFKDTEDEAVAYKIVHAQLNKGYTYHGLNDYAKGAQAFEENLEYLQDKEFYFVQEYGAKSLLGMGLSYYYLENLDDEIACYQQIFQKYSDQPSDDGRKVVMQAMLNAASTYETQGKIDQEIASYDQVWNYAHDTENPELLQYVVRALLNKAVTLSNQGQHFSACVCYDQLLERAQEVDFAPVNISFAHACLNKARSYKNRNLPKDEVMALQRLIQRFQESDDITLVELVMTAYLNLGLVYDTKGNHQKEVEQYLLAINLFVQHQHDQELKSVAGQIMFNSIIALRQLGQLEQETEIAEQFTQWFADIENEKLAGQVRETHFRLAELYLYLQQPSKALNLYRYVLTEHFLSKAQIDDHLRFELLKARFNQASILVMQNMEGGEQACQAFIDRYSYDADNASRIQQMRFNLGLSLKEQGRFEEAMAIFDQLIDEQSNEDETIQQQAAKAFFAKAECLNELGKDHEQLHLCDSFLQRYANSQDPVIHDQLAQVLLNKAVLLGAQGHIEQALGLYQEVEQRFALDDSQGLVGAVARSLLQQSLCHQHLNQLDRAEDCLDKLLDQYAYQPALQELVAQAQLVQNQLSEQRIVH